MKEVHPSLWMENHIQAHKFFNQYTEDNLVYAQEETVDHFNNIDIF
jgi:hypothetical protein